MVGRLFEEILIYFSFDNYIFMKLKIGKDKKIQKVKLTQQVRTTTGSPKHDGNDNTSFVHKALVHRQVNPKNNSSHNPKPSPSISISIHSSERSNDKTSFYKSE